MARRPRIQLAGALYHVIFRGNERRVLFHDDRDRRRFLQNLAERIPPYDIRLFLYCLMSNHVHLLLETPRGNLSGFMGSLLTSYSTYFNLRHRRSGHLTQGRFTSPLVERNNYLLRLSRYIHLNPVRVKGLSRLPLNERRARLRRYPWSSYRAYTGLAETPEWLDCAPVLAMLEVPARQRRRRYRAFVESGLVERDKELAAVMEASSLATGSEQFRRRLAFQQEQESKRRVEPEDVAFRRPAQRAAPEAITQAVCRHFNVTSESLRRPRKRDRIKPVWAALLTRYAGLTQRQTARYMGLTTGAAVCQQLRKLRGPAGAASQQSVHTIAITFNF
jgi:putative transposase